MSLAALRVGLVREGEDGGVVVVVSWPGAANECACGCDRPELVSEHDPGFLASGEQHSAGALGFFDQRVQQFGELFGLAAVVPVEEIVDHDELRSAGEASSEPDERTLPVRQLAPAAADQVLSPDTVERSRRAPTHVPAAVDSKRRPDVFGDLALAVWAGAADPHD